MIRATKVHPAGSWSDAASDTVVLEFDDRHRRRTVMNGVRDLAFLLDLPEAVMLRAGDALELEDGRLVEVVSAPEALIEVRGGSPRDLVRLSWHIGNRHLPAQVMPNAIRIRHDHVIEAMLRGLGAKLVTIEAPFDPEGGAYASAGSHGGHEQLVHEHGGAKHHGHVHDSHEHHDHQRHEHEEEHGHDHHGHDHKHPKGHHHDH